MQWKRQNVRTYIFTFDFTKIFSNCLHKKGVLYDYLSTLLRFSCPRPLSSMLPLFPRKISLNLTVQWGVKTATFYQRSVSKNNDCHKMYLSKKVSNCEANTPFLNDFFIFSDVFSKKSKNSHMEWMNSISAAMHIIQYSCRPINTMVVRQKNQPQKDVFK